MKALAFAFALALTAQGSTASTVKDRLRRPLAADGPTCVDVDRIVSRKASAPDTLTVELSGGRRLAMTLADACPHLADIDRTYTIVFDQRDGSRLCRGSRFQVVDPLVARSGGTGGFPFCRVSRFTDLSTPRR